MQVRKYQELIVWQKAIAFVTHIYTITATFPHAEIYGLVSQLRRAAVSVPSNIAEGHGRATTGEFVQFLCHARGSLCEVETQIVICRDWATSLRAGTALSLASSERAGTNSERSDHFTPDETGQASQPA